MSQTSGGEAGSPPPAVVAAGMHFIFIKKTRVLSGQHEQCWQRSYQKECDLRLVLGFKIYTFKIKKIEYNFIDIIIIS